MMANHVGLIARILKSPLSFFGLAISFFASGLTINAIQFLLYWCVRPINKRVFQRIFYYTTYWLHIQLVFVAEWWGGLDVVCHTEETNMEKYIGKEHALCIMNHVYEIDWLAIFALCDRVRMMGNCRAFAKKEIQYMPILGWSLKMGGDVFLDRNWEKDKEVIGKQVTKLVQFPSAMWLMMMAEGTRFTEAKHEASQKFAQEKGLPLLKHHLTPRTKGFAHTVPYLRGKIDAIYDIQLAFKQGIEPTMVGLLKGEKYEAHFYVNRIPISTLPEGEEELSNWMHQLYQKKDKMADSFMNTGDFFRESGAPVVPTYRLPRRCCSLLVVLTCCLLTLSPIISYLAGILMSGSLLSIGIVAAVIAIGAIIVVLMIRMTVISKGSAYGSTTTKTKSE